MKETKWFPGCSARSNDGKFCANVTPFTQGRVPQKYFRNFVVTPGDQAGWSARLNGTVAPFIDIFEGPYLQYWVKNWGPNSTWNFEMDVYTAKKTYLRKSIKAPVQNNTFSFTVPKEGQNFYVTLTLANNDQISFDPLVGNLPLRVRQDSKVDDKSTTTWN
jgi:hypothetical protein